MKIKRLAAALVAVVMIFACTSCATIVVKVPAVNLQAIADRLNTNSNTNTNTNNNSNQNTTPEPSVSQNTETPSENTDTPSEAPSQNGETPSSTPETPTEKPASGMPSTKEEIINYYVTAYNKIATDSKKVVRTFDTTTNYNNIVQIGSNEKIADLAESLMTKFMKPNDEDLEKTPSDLPPVGVTTLSISPSQISSATCVDKGSYYEVTLKSTGTDSNYEIDSVAGKGSAGVIGPLLRTEDVTGAAGSLIKFEGLHAKYATCSVTAKIDKASGHITDFSFRSPCILHFDKVTALVIVKVENCDLGLLFEQTWTVAY